MKAFKKVFAVFLTFVLLFSAVSNSFVAAATEITPVVEEMEFQPITLNASGNENDTIEQLENGQWYYNYNIGNLLNATISLQGGDVIYANGNSVSIDGNVYGFSYDYIPDEPWEPGNTYEVEVSLLGVSSIVLVTIAESPVDNIVFEPVEVIYNYDGTYYEHNGEEFFYYYWQDLLKGNVWFNGSEEPIESSGYGVYYNDEWLYFLTKNFQYDEHWELGGTYYIPVGFMGKVIEVPVSVVESPIESITFEDINLIENSKGSIQIDENDNEYFNYSWIWDAKCYIKLKNIDEVLEVNSTSFEYNGNWYNMSYEDDQAENHWTVGNTYSAKVSLLGCEANVNVTITTSPIESITFKPTNIYDHTCGYISNDSYGNSYYNYDWVNRLEYTVKFKDNSTLNGYGNSFYYNDECYSLDYDDSQWSNHWEAGNTYDVEINVLGYSTNANINILESPIEYVTVSPVNVIDNMTGYTVNDEENNEFFYYNWEYKIKYSIKYKDKDELITGNGTSFEYNGEWYSISSSDNQYEDHWVLNGTYNTTANFMGYEVTVPVTVVGSPVKSFKVVPENISLIANKDGNWCWGEDGSSWYEYSWQDKIQLEFTLEDDSKILSSDLNGVWINDEYHDISYDYSQQWFEPWVAGNTYTVEIYSPFGTAQFNVSIINETESGNFKYINQGENAIITDCIGTNNGVINIPSVIDGRKVVGVTGLSGAIYNATELIIPDTVTMLSNDIFYNGYELEKLTLGKGITEVSNDLFFYCFELEEFIVSQDHPTLTVVDGVIYDKDITKIVAFPRMKTGLYTVPDTVTDVSVVFDNLYTYDKVLIDFGNSNTDYVQVDGVYYSKDMKTVYKCATDATGTYTMPNTVEEIKSNAFSGCNFNKIIISENVTNIVYSAFSYSMALEKVVLPSNLTSVGDYAFSSCENLTELNLPLSVKTIGHYAFSKTGLTNVTIPSSVISIGSSAYSDSQLSKITLNDGLESIDYYAFANTYLNDVKLPNSLTYLGSYAFYNSPLKNITFGNGLSSIHDNTFANTNLTSISVPRNIEYIGYYAFANAPLKYVALENEGISIGNGAFYRCPVESLDIKEGTVEIGQYAFYGSSLTSIKLPESVTDITYSSFAESKKLLNIDVSENLKSLSGTAFEGTAWYNSQANGLVYLENYLYNYKGAIPQNSEISIKSGTKLIADFALYSQNGLTKVTIPGSVKSIGESAFAYCNSLESVVINDGVENIDYYAFCECLNLNTIIIPSSVKTIEYGAFENCQNLKNVWYIGSESDRENLVFDTWSNEYLESAEWHYIDDINDTSCNKCDAEKSAEHVYSNSCDHTCNVCGFERVKSEHIYNNSCDTDCNECGVKRSIKHTYDNNCDTTCNVCGATRAITHKYDSGKVTKAATCKATGVKTYTCTVCKATKTETIKKTTTHKYTTTTTKATLTKNGKIVKKCSVCGVSTSTTINYVKSFALTTTSYTYSGAVRTPGVIVKDSAGKTLVKNTDYTVSYASGRVNAGTYKVTVTMKGNYSGSKTLTFKINPISYSKCKFALTTTNYTYNGGVKTPGATVKYGSLTLKKNVDYTVAYASGRKNVGTYKVTIKMKGNYTGTKTLTFKINPPKTTVSKLTAGKKSITVAITKKSSQVTGYQVQYSTSKSFSKATTKTISSYKTTKYTLKSLSAKKTYYVRVRTYKTVGKTKYYSGWSTYKYVKTK